MGFDNIDRKHVGKAPPSGAFDRIAAKHAAEPVKPAGCDHKWILRGGMACGCDWGECSFHVHECELCGDCDYGDNPEARAIKAGCGAMKAAQAANQCAAIMADYPERFPKSFVGVDPGCEPSMSLYETRTTASGVTLQIAHAPLGEPFSTLIEKLKKGESR